MFRRGFSLLEVLVVIAIIAIIAALLFPVLSRAREKALESQETHQLKQLSVAHGVYVGDFDDAEPGSSIPIIRAGYAPSGLVASPLDPFLYGWANEDRRDDDFERKTNYKDSFQTLAGAAGQQFFPSFRESTNGGWLIAAGPHLVKFGTDVILQPTIKYKRLTFAGGVIVRPFPA